MFSFTDIPDEKSVPDIWAVSDKDKVTSDI